MKYFALLLMLFFILYSSETNSQQYDETVCPILSINPKAPASQTGGKYKPASNLPGQYFRVLVVFVQFEGDNRQDAAWNPGQMPSWADDFINSQTLSEYTDMTMSDYWKEMSIGNFDFIGDVYPELVVLPPESTYYQIGKNYSHCNRDVLTLIDPYVNFSLYDNWKLVSGQFIFSPGNSDKLVDMVFMIYRNPGESTTPNWFGEFSGISMLGFSPEFVTNDLNSVGQTIKVNGGLQSSGSGLTIRTGLAGHYGVMGLCNHEFGHYLFGYDHISWGGIMGGSTYALSGWERERLGYVAYTVVYQDNFSTTLSDFISTGNILKIPIPITNPNSPNFFLVENHQRLSHYDQITQGGSLNGQFVLETTVGAGIYITLNYHADVFEQLEVYTKVADGNFDWQYDGDFYAPGFHVQTNCPDYVPKTKRIAVNRHLGKNDRTYNHILWCNITASKWCDINEYGNYWLSRDVMGDDTDPFTLTNNVLFSPWSNPSSYSSLTGGATNYSVWLYNQNGNNISIQVKTTVNSSLSLPPSKPQFLKVQSGQNNRPYLTWDANIESDILRYDIWKKKFINGNWQWSFLALTTNTNYLDVTEVFCGPPPAQCENQQYVYYKILAVDTQLLQSVFTDPVAAAVQGSPPDKISADPPIIEKPMEYSLMQNYPNPFNPATTISYSIPNNGLATLKVYNILGIEVAELVNEVKDAGNYSVTFNASELPSGIYFYTLTSGNFMATKKLILLK